MFYFSDNHVCYFGICSFLVFIQDALHWFFHLCSDNGPGMVDMKTVKLESDLVGSGLQGENHQNAQLAEFRNSIIAQSGRQEFEENRCSTALSNGQSASSVLEQGQSPVDDTGISSASTICPAPLCRQFWKAGNYDDGLGSKVTFQSTYQFICMVQSKIIKVACEP